MAKADSEHKHMASHRTSEHLDAFAATLRDLLGQQWPYTYRHSDVAIRAAIRKHNSNDYAENTVPIKASLEKAAEDRHNVPPIALSTCEPEAEAPKVPLDC